MPFIPDVSPSKNIHELLRENLPSTFVDKEVSSSNYLGKMVRWMREDLSTIQCVVIVVGLFLTGVGIIADIALGITYKLQVSKENSAQSKFQALVSQKLITAKKASGENATQPPIEVTEELQPQPIGSFTVVKTANQFKFFIKNADKTYESTLNQSEFLEKTSISKQLVLLKKNNQFLENMAAALKQLSTQANDSYLLTRNPKSSEFILLVKDKEGNIHQKAIDHSELLSIAIQKKLCEVDNFITLRKLEIEERINDSKERPAKLMEGAAVGDCVIRLSPVVNEIEVIVKIPQFPESEYRSTSSTATIRVDAEKTKLAEVLDGLHSKEFWLKEENLKLLNLSFAPKEETDRNKLYYVSTSSKNPAEHVLLLQYKDRNDYGYTGQTAYYEASFNRKENFLIQLARFENFKQLKEARDRDLTSLYPKPSICTSMDEVPNNPPLGSIYLIKQPDGGVIFKQALPNGRLASIEIPLKKSLTSEYTRFTNSHGNPPGIIAVAKETGDYSPTFPVTADQFSDNQPYLLTYDNKELKCWYKNYESKVVSTTLDNFNAITQIEDILKQQIEIRTLIEDGKIGTSVNTSARYFIKQDANGAYTLCLRVGKFNILAHPVKYYQTVTTAFNNLSTDYRYTLQNGGIYHITSSFYRQPFPTLYIINEFDRSDRPFCIHEINSTIYCCAWNKDDEFEYRPIFNIHAAPKAEDFFLAVEKVLKEIHARSKASIAKMDYLEAMKKQLKLLEKLSKQPQHAALNFTSYNAYIKKVIEEVKQVLEVKNLDFDSDTISFQHSQKLNLKLATALHPDKTRGLPIAIQALPELKETFQKISEKWKKFKAAIEEDFAKLDKEHDLKVPKQQAEAPPTAAPKKTEAPKTAAPSGIDDVD